MNLGLLPDEQKRISDLNTVYQEISYNEQVISNFISLSNEVNDELELEALFISKQQILLKYLPTNESDLI